MLFTLAPPLKAALDRKGKHVPCPVHGGRDGFRIFPDVAETGGGICNTCGSFANGFALLMWINGWDLAIAADTASFAIPGGKAGLFCHTPLVALARNVGRKRALEMAMTGDAISAATAVDWGLINRAVPADQLDSAVLDLITRATRGSELSKGNGKRGFYAQMEMPQTSAYQLAVELMATGAVSSDGQEGIQAFLQKRHANYTQRCES